MAREALRGDPADVGDVEAKRTRRNGIDRDCLDRGNSFDGALLLEAVELEELRFRQPVELRQRPNEPEIPEPAHELLPHPLDVSGRLHPVDQRSRPLVRDRRGWGSGA